MACGSFFSLADSFFCHRQPEQCHLLRASGQHTHTAHKLLTSSEVEASQVDAKQQAHTHTQQASERLLQVIIVSLSKPFAVCCFCSQMFSASLFRSFACLLAAYYYYYFPSTSKVGQAAASKVEAREKRASNFFSLSLFLVLSWRKKSAQTLSLDTQS